MKLNDRVVLITGASSGIGEATALRCAAAGARVVLAARRADQLAALAGRIAALGRQALAVPTDVTDDDQVRALADTALDRFGCVDVLVNNAGFGVLDPFPRARLADLQAMVEVNLYGVVRCTQALLPHMLARRRGQIVNVASLAGRLATHNFAFYNATKFALVGMSRALQLDLRGTGVRCAIICPGAVRTAFIQRAGEHKIGRTARIIPWLEADDVARAIVRAIARGSHDEVLIPAIARPLIAAANALPNVTRLVVGLLR